MISYTYTIEDLRRSGLVYVPSAAGRSKLAPGCGPMALENRRLRRLWNVNSKGFRTPEFASQPASNVVRVLFLGGSSVFGFEDAEPNAGCWPGYVEMLLRRAGHNVECVNAAIPGYCLFDCAVRFMSELWMYQPDIVVICEAWNDIKYFREISPDTTYEGLMSPLRILGGDPLYTHQSALDKLLCMSRLYVKARTRWILARRGTEGAKRRDPDIAESFSPWATRQYEVAAQSVIATALMIPASVILCSQPRLVSPDNSAEEREHIGYSYVGLSRQALCLAFDACDGALRKIAGEAWGNVAYMDLAGAIKPDLTHFIDHVHLRDKGAWRVAEAFASRLMTNDVFLAALRRSEMGASVGAEALHGEGQRSRIPELDTTPRPEL